MSARARVTRLVLGADDPEMRAIEGVARAARVPCIYATVGGRRVGPGEAYASDLDPALGDLWVECMPDLVRPQPWRLALGRDWYRADHHRPGDVGYGRPPADFWAASSLGQVVTALIQAGHAGALAVAWGDASAAVPGDDGARVSGALTRVGSGWYVQVATPDLAVAYGQDIPNLGLLRIPPELPLIAAADHSLAPAYAGQCPGVDPDALLTWRLTAPGSPHTSEPDGQGGRRAVPPEVVRERAELARHLLGAAWTSDGGLTFASGFVRLGPIEAEEGRFDAVDAVDLRRFGAATVGLPIADVAARLGLAYVLHVREGYGSHAGPWPLKVVLGGCGEGSVPGVLPMAVWQDWCRARGYRGLAYGDPARGYAGCYMEGEAWSIAASHEAARARKLADADHLERLAAEEWAAEAAVSRAWAAVLRAEAHGVPGDDGRMVALRAEHARACQAETSWRES